jgi:hypothetical protein
MAFASFLVTPLNSHENVSIMSALKKLTNPLDNLAEISPDSGI